TWVVTPSLYEASTFDNEEKFILGEKTCMCITFIPVDGSLVAQRGSRHRMGENPSSEWRSLYHCDIASNFCHGQ
ncbi:hypothetical protein NPIL_679081, partial [Nephila pilipes]